MLLHCKSPFSRPPTCLSLPVGCHAAAALVSPLALVHVKLYYNPLPTELPVLAILLCDCAKLSMVVQGFVIIHSDAVFSVQCCVSLVVRLELGLCLTNTLTPSSFFK